MFVFSRVWNDCFVSCRGFSLNMNSLLDEEETLFSRLGPLPVNKHLLTWYPKTIRLCDTFILYLSQVLIKDVLFLHLPHNSKVMLFSNVPYAFYESNTSQPDSIIALLILRYHVKDIATFYKIHIAQPLFLIGFLDTFLLENMFFDWCYSRCVARGTWGTTWSGGGRRDWRESKSRYQGAICHSAPSGPSGDITLLLPAVITFLVTLTSL